MPSVTTFIANTFSINGVPQSEVEQMMCEELLQALVQ
ncbi:hypothetical protein ACT4UM_13480, partial [Bacillus sp. SS-TM]